MAKEKVVTPNLSESELDKMAEDSAKKIKEENELVRVKIPKDPLNPDDHTVPVCINGYIWYIKRGEAVKVPAVVEEVLENAGYI